MDAQEDSPVPPAGSRAKGGPPCPGARPRLSEQLAQALVPRPAQRQAAAVLQDGDAAVLGVQLDAIEPVEIEDPGSMDAHEAARVERRLEIADGLLLEVGLPGRLHGDV